MRGQCWLQVESPTQLGPITQAPVSHGVCAQRVHLASSFALFLHALGVEVNVAASKRGHCVVDLLGDGAGRLLNGVEAGCDLQYLSPYSTDKALALNSLVHALLGF